MPIKYENKNCLGIKIITEEDGKVIGRAYLYILYNDLHKEPFGFLEDLYVDESVRGQGIGKKLVYAIIEKAKENDCYKLVANSRNSRKEIHEFYKKFGFKDYGKEFRINF